MATHLPAQEAAKASSDGPGNVTLGSASYTAQQVPGAVLIFAHGKHLQAGYTVFFEQSPIEIYPPQFIFWEARPADALPYVPTEFFQWTMFRADAVVEKVVIHDAAGEHSIDVEQVPDLQGVRTRGNRGAEAVEGGEGPHPDLRHSFGEGGASTRLFRIAGEGGPGTFLLTLGGEGPTPFILGHGGEGTNPFAFDAGHGLRVAVPTSQDDDPIIKMTIGAFLEQEPQFSRLAGYLAKAGLLEPLKQPGNVTLFAPTNGAVLSLTADALKLLEDQSKLRELLQYHMYSQGQMKLQDIRNMRSIHMDNGKQVWVHGSEQVVWLRDQSNRRIDFRQNDLVFSNGVIHIINRVMWPWQELPFTHETATTESAPMIAKLFTAYQFTPVPFHVNGTEHAIRTVYLTARIQGSGGSGELRLDASTCKTFDNFGEPSECSAGTLAPSAVSLSQVYAWDQTGKGRALYQVRCAEIGEHLLLVVPLDRRDSYRLIVKDKGEVPPRNVLTFEVDR